jgi:hypothetical protein
MLEYELERTQSELAELSGVFESVESLGYN